MEHELTSLENKRLLRAYWLPGDNSVLFHTDDRRFYELRVEKGELEKSGAYPFLCQVDHGLALQDAMVLEVKTEPFTYNQANSKCSVMIMSIRTNTGTCKIAAVMDKVTDDNQVEFALSEYIGYPPEDATTLSWVYNGKAQEKPENDPCLH